MTVVWIVLIIHFLLLGLAMALALGTRFRQADIEARQQRQHERLNGLARWMKAPGAGNGSRQDEEEMI